MRSLRSVAVVFGVSKVIKPITPILTPLTSYI